MSSLPKSLYVQLDDPYNVAWSTKILIPRYYEIPKRKEKRGIVLILLSTQLDLSD